MILNSGKSFHKLYLLLCVAVIILLSCFGRRLQLAITKFVDGRWIGWGIIILLLLILGAIFASQRKRGKVSGVVLGGALLILFGGGLAVHLGYLRPVEMMHFLLFSWFGWLSAAVFGLARGLLVVLGMAVGDEILQHFLPDRIGDFHDILINTLSGLVGLLLRRRP